MQPSFVAALDQVIAYFNSRRLDLPDGFFDRKTQFVINGTPFESLLSNAPNDPLVMMLARGPAGYRFTVKALQHAMPDARVERGELAAGVEPSRVSAKLWLSGTPRGTGAAMNALINVALRLTESGLIGTVEATMDAGELDRIREARLRP
jgi:hypothetical protein